MSRPTLPPHAALLCAGCLSTIVILGCSKEKVIPTRPVIPTLIHAFAVSSVVANVNQANYSGPCPGAFEISAQIAANDSGFVVYQWERSDGWVGPMTLLKFTAAGTQTVTNSWSPEAHGSFWERLRVLAPNQLISGQASFTNQCGTTVTARTSVTRNGTSCPGTYDFTTTVTADAPISLTYRWEGSDGHLGPWGTLGLAGGEATVTMSRVITQNGTFWERVHILAPPYEQAAPVDVYSTRASFDNYCSGFSAIATVSASDGYCSDTVDFTGQISTTSQGTVTYRWERSDGEIGPTENLEFAAAGTQTVTISSLSPTGDAFSERIHLLAPNDSYSNEAIGTPYWDSCCWGCDQ